ncbi:S8 family peptidase [Bdellovibrio sp. HCB209]|uniref:S8 family peptidase n=1 Tax=Bdellovibrio sp. HCB209 TaxID=3394354 RepID=UPI0039B646CD
MRTLSYIQKTFFGILSATPFLWPAVAQPRTSDPDRDIVIAIIDTGIDVNHPLIKDNLWVNPNEKANGLDNDGNGYAGDLHGWNFVSENGDITDNHGHGTHIAGIIRQRTLSSRVKFMVLKYYDPTQSGRVNLINTVRAIRYATKMKADIINYSGGGDTRSALEEKAIREAQDQGILFVAAAGNDGRNTDKMGYYPAGYKLKNIISVAAMDSSRHLIDSSNYGSQSVDIAAPGKNVYSSLPGGQFGLMTGTSQATAWVTGLAAALMLQNPSLRNPETIKMKLETEGTRDEGLVGKLKSTVRITALQNDISSL